MKFLKKLISRLISIIINRNNSHELQTYMELEMRKVSNLEDKKFNEKLLNRVS